MPIFPNYLFITDYLFLTFYRLRLFLGSTKLHLNSLITKAKFNFGGTFGETFGIGQGFA